MGRSPSWGRRDLEVAWSSRIQREMERLKSTADEGVAWRPGRVCWEREVVQEYEAGEHGRAHAKGFWGAVERVPAKSCCPVCMLARLLWSQCGGLKQGRLKAGMSFAGCFGNPGGARAGCQGQRALRLRLRHGLLCGWGSRGVGSLPHTGGQHWDTCPWEVDAAVVSTSPSLCC